MGRSAVSIVLFLSTTQGWGQQAENAPTLPPSVRARVQQLERAIEQAQMQLDGSRRELEAVKKELALQEAELASRKPVGLPVVADSPVATETSSSGEQVSETQSAVATEQAAMQASQIATLDQIKVESGSKYPLRLTGTLLLNGFINTGRVDEAASPSAALGGKGSTGLSIRQTVLGFDADGPRLFGATSHADMRVDFFGSAGGQTYNSVAELLRLRTAHAALEWKRTRLFFALDRPLINPNMPESLVAVAQPELAWSGNLWSWNPQVGIAQTLGTKTRLRFEAALIDPADPAASTGTGNATISPSLANTAETSRHPGAEARISMLSSDDNHGAQFGIGGYFAPHLVATNSISTGVAFDAWAATLDYRLSFGHGVVLSGSAYRGQALGGLGGGGYKDYVYRGSGTGLVIRPLEDVGGWSQLHQSLSQKVSWNAGFGIDNAFSHQVRLYPATSAGNVYGSIARNRTVFANVIYSPSAYLKLSVEYRNLYTAPSPGKLWISNSTGIGAAYSF